MHRFANPTRFASLASKLATPLLLSGLLLAGGACLWGLLMAPAERLQGETVRILFVHVPSVWLAMAGWAGIAIASIAQLVWRHPLAGIAARACAVPGAVFTAFGLATGSIWGRPAWGAWWVWDGRLTSFLVLFFLYLAYIALAGGVRRNEGGERIAAIFGIVGVVNIPIIKMSVEWWHSQHQRASIGLSGSSMDEAFLVPLLVSALGFSLIFGGVVLLRMMTELAENKAEARLRRMAA